jgi:methylenetetrahydrofolate reductase (NADPH)
VSQRTFSVEFFPPKDHEGEERLWQAMAAIQELQPDFASVTYGAGGSTRDRTLRITQEITARSGVPTVAHLTCVGSTAHELEEILHLYKEAGISRILALRGDPVGGPAAPWVSTPGGFDHAEQLVSLAKRVGGFSIGVAAFPDGHPASAGNFDQDIDVLVRKEELGANFATTQFFFDINRYLRLVDALHSRRSNLPVIAGILPITNVKQLDRMATLSGTPIPKNLASKFHDIQDDPESVRKLGVEVASELAKELIDNNVPGLHFYTMNSSAATLEVARNLGLPS